MRDTSVGVDKHNEIGHPGFRPSNMGSRRKPLGVTSATVRCEREIGPTLRTPWRSPSARAGYAPLGRSLTQ